MFSQELVKLGINLVSIDLSPDLLEQAKKRVSNERAQFLLQDAENLTLPNESFDAVVGISILHHLRIEAALPQVLRVLKPGGRFVFTEPNMLNPQVFLERHVPSIRESSGTSPDETAFYRWQLKRFLLAEGFQDVSVQPFDFLHPRTPEFAIPFVRALGRIVEHVPLAREISGSLLIHGMKNT